MRIKIFFLFTLTSFLLCTTVYGISHPENLDDLDPIKNTIWHFTTDAGEKDFYIYPDVYYFGDDTAYLLCSDINNDDMDLGYVVVTDTQSNPYLTGICYMIVMDQNFFAPRSLLYCFQIDQNSASGFLQEYSPNDDWYGPLTPLSGQKNQECNDSDSDGYYAESDCGTAVDCNDDDASVNPGTTEICGDGIDQDCDGSDLTCEPVPEDIDDDGDGFTENQNDCDDTDPSAYPGASEICGDGIDQDCNGSDLACGNGDSKYKIYFPHVASDGRWETEVCVINSSAESITGVFKPYTDDGESISDDISATLNSHQRKEIIVGDEFTDPSDIGYIVFESDSENIVGYTKFYIDGQYRVAVPAIAEITSGDLYISHIASTDKWWTGVSIVNTETDSKDLTIEFDNGTTKNISLDSLEHKAFSIKSLFGNSPQTELKSAIIKNADGIVGLELFGSKNQLSGILLKNDISKDMYYPHIASDKKWWTGIVAYNPSASNCTLTINPYTAAGTALNAKTVILSEYEKYVGTASSLGLPSESAWFQIKATQPITGFELFGTCDSKLLAGYTGVNISNTDGIFAKIEKDGWTGIAFVNIGSTSATVNLTAYSDAGNAIDTQAITLSAYEKKVDNPDNIFDKDISSATYISYSSGQQLVGFQLNGSSDSMMLDGLPGLPGLPGSSGSDSERTIQINPDPQDPIIALITNDESGETLLMMGEKDENGSPTKITSMHHRKSGQTWKDQPTSILFNDQGLPSYISTPEGETSSFEYEEDICTLTYQDKDGAIHIVTFSIDDETLQGLISQMATAPSQSNAQGGENLSGMELFDNDYETIHIKKVTGILKVFIIEKNSGKLIGRTTKPTVRVDPSEPSPYHTSVAKPADSEFSEYYDVEIYHRVTDLVVSKEKAAELSESLGTIFTLTGGTALVVGALIAGPPGAIGTAATIAMAVGNISTASGVVTLAGSKAAKWSVEKSGVGKKTIKFIVEDKSLGLYREDSFTYDIYEIDDPFQNFSHTINVYIDAGILDVKVSPSCPDMCQSYKVDFKFIPPGATIKYNVTSQGDGFSFSETLQGGETGDTLTSATIYSGDKGVYDKIESSILIDDVEVGKGRVVNFHTNRKNNAQPLLGNFRPGCKNEDDSWPKIYKGKGTYIFRWVRYYNFVMDHDCSMGEGKTDFRVEISENGMFEVDFVNNFGKAFIDHSGTRYNDGVGEWDVDCNPQEPGEWDGAFWGTWDEQGNLIQNQYMTGAMGGSFTSLYLSGSGHKLYPSENNPVDAYFFIFNNLERVQ